jgi:hypothetical protein
MDMADKSIHPHEVIHMRMTYEDCINGFEDALCQVMDDAAVEEDAATEGLYEKK